MYSPKYGPTEVRRSFKTPEGVYKLKVEKRHGQVSYSIERQGTRLSVGQLKGGVEEGWYVLLNLGEAIHICLLDSIDRVSGNLYSLEMTQMGLDVAGLSGGIGGRVWGSCIGGACHAETVS